MADEVYDVIVVGGGAAGMMAAGAAAEAGGSVLLLERMKRPGRKLRISGKGRCNLTNSAELSEFIRHFGKNGNFLRPVFEQWFNRDLIVFFKRLGVPTVTERGGRIFPASGLATDVVDALVRWVRSCGVRMVTDFRVERLLIDAGKIRGVAGNGREYRAKAVVLATGGASYPATGSSGDGYRLAESAGHSVVAVRPALVPLEVAEKFATASAGLELRNIRMCVLADGEPVAEYFGEFRFESYGVSGPVVLTASGGVVDLLRAGKNVELSLDLKPALSEQKLENRLRRDLQKRGREPMSSILRGLLPRQLVRPALRGCRIQGHRLGSSLKESERAGLQQWLKDVRLTVTGHRPWSEAIVTAGGVALGEISEQTMESHIVEGLFFAGELPDIQADTGGYNLQAAFSTGRLAGVAAVT